MTLPEGWVFKTEPAFTECLDRLSAGEEGDEASDVWIDRHNWNEPAHMRSGEEWSLEEIQALGALAEEILRRRYGSPARRAAEQTVIPSLLDDAWRRNASPAFARP